MYQYVLSFFRHALGGTFGLAAVLSAPHNVASQWRRAKIAQNSRETSSRRPLNSPGYADSLLPRLLSYSQIARSVSCTDHPRAVAICATFAR